MALAVCLRQFGDGHDHHDENYVCAMNIDFYSVTKNNHFFLIILNSLFFFHQTNFPVHFGSFLENWGRVNLEKSLNLMLSFGFCA